MTTDKERRFTVITNTEAEVRAKENEREKSATPPPDFGYHTNPMYEKLLKFKEEQKKKRFTVEDLLKW